MRICLLWLLIFENHFRSALGFSLLLVFFSGLYLCFFLLYLLVSFWFMFSFLFVVCSSFFMLYIFDSFWFVLVSFCCIFWFLYALYFCFFPCFVCTSCSSFLLFNFPNYVSVLFLFLCSILYPSSFTDC